MNSLEFTLFADRSYFLIFLEALEFAIVDIDRGPEGQVGITLLPIDSVCVDQISTVFILQWHEYSRFF